MMLVGYVITTQYLAGSFTIAIDHVLSESDDSPEEPAEPSPEQVEEREEENQSECLQPLKEKLTNILSTKAFSVVKVIVVGGNLVCLAYFTPKIKPTTLTQVIQNLVVGCSFALFLF